MPLDEIRAVLQAPDLRTRNDLIAGHFARLERELAHTQAVVASLRHLLQGLPAPSRIDHRSEVETDSAAISAVVERGEALAWFQGAIGEIYATLTAQGVPPAGPAGSVIADGLFSDERGELTVFVPAGASIRPVGRVRPATIPAAELATIVHVGPWADLDRAYGSLATYVAEHALGVAGPIRERYLVGRQDTLDESAWRTEVGWPIFHTRQPAQAPQPSERRARRMRRVTDPTRGLPIRGDHAE
jgi:effector-binding domain-containing protein